MDELRELTEQEITELSVQVRKVWCEEQKQFLPSVKARETRGTRKLYQLNERTFVYEPITEMGLTAAEQELMTQPISRWGRAWQQYMTENYPEDIPKLQGRLLWELIPRKIDREAWEISEKMRENYQQTNPRPTSGNAIVWEERLKALTEEQITDCLVNVRRTDL